MFTLTRIITPKSANGLLHTSRFGMPVLDLDCLRQIQRHSASTFFKILRHTFDSWNNNGAFRDLLVSIRKNTSENSISPALLELLILQEFAKQKLNNQICMLDFYLEYLELGSENKVKNFYAF